MSAERDTTRIVRSWLRADEHESADRVLQIVLAGLDAAPQRRSWWPAWRFAQMNNIRIAIAAAAVVVAAVVGYNLLPGHGGIGGPNTSPSPTPVVSPTAPAPIPSGSMSPGTYSLTDAGLTLVPYTFTVPAGWTGGDGASRGDMRGNGVRLTTWIITHVYSNSCQWAGTLVPVADKAALVAALTSQVGHTHSTPVEMTIGGLAATKITFTLDAAFDVATCDAAPGGAGFVRLWPDPGPDESGGWLISPGQTTTVFVIEANGKVMVLMTVQRNDSAPADVAALQQILDSVEFQPTP
jgi:hypothetical protein